MAVTVKITNKKLFNEKVIEVDTSDLQGNNNHNGIQGNFYAQGNMSIGIKKQKSDIFGEWKEITGEFGSHDYEEEFGFILEEK